MRALCWHGKSDVQHDTVPDPKIEDEADLATDQGIDQFYSAVRSKGRPVDALLANAEHGLGKALRTLLAPCSVTG